MRGRVDATLVPERPGEALDLRPLGVVPRDLPARDARDARVVEGRHHPRDPLVVDRDGVRREDKTRSCGTRSMPTLSAFE